MSTTNNRERQLDASGMDLERVREELLGIANIASSLIDRADALRAELGRSPGDVTREQRAQLAHMRDRGWEIRVVDQVEDGILIVEGVDLSGDKFRGHITDKGGFNGSPVGVGRSNQRVWISPVDAADFDAGIEPGPVDEVF
jgi:hypothetical protein